jgi:nucleoside-diphosphate-sugar epimerase
LCRKLLSEGAKVRGLVRDPAAAADLQALGVELISGDLHNQGALNTLVHNCQAVVHLAGAVRGGSYRSFEIPNVEGTANLCRALRSQQEPPRLLLFSSLVAREPELSWYSRSKQAAESELLRNGAELDWTILRPPAVYGPGDKEMMPIFQAMAKGVAPVPGAVDARTSLIHVDDLVAASISCLSSEAASGQLFHLDDGRPGGYDWTEMAAIAARVYGRTVRLWPVPALLLDAVAGLNLVLARVTGRAPMLTPAKLRELRHPDWVVDNKAITQATGWSPRIELLQGLQALQKAAL